MLTILAEVAEHSTGIPPIAYGIGAFLVLALLGLVTFSYRDVAHRHDDKMPVQHNEPNHHK